MPSAKILEEKKAIVTGLAEKLSGSVAGVLFDYKGINVADDTKLRRELRTAGVDYHVVNNRLLALAADQAGYSDLKPVLEGTTAMAVSSDDYVAAARILSKHVDASKGAQSIKLGFIDNNVISPAEIKNLAELPSREVLVAKALGGLNAPISGFAGVCSGVLRGLVVALGAIAEKQSA